MNISQNKQHSSKKKPKFLKRLKKYSKEERKIIQRRYWNRRMLRKSRFKNEIELLDFKINEYSRLLNNTNLFRNPYFWFERGRAKTSQLLTFLNERRHKIILQNEKKYFGLQQMSKNDIIEHFKERESQLKADNSNLVEQKAILTNHNNELRSEIERFENCKIKINSPSYILTNFFALLKKTKYTDNKKFISRTDSDNLLNLIHTFIQPTENYMKRKGSSKGWSKESLKQGLKPSEAINNGAFKEFIEKLNIALTDLDNPGKKNKFEITF